MDETLIETARGYLTSFIYGKKSPQETIHPWRTGWEFVYLHSMRVEAITARLMKDEWAADPSTRLDPETVLTVRLAAVLHDIGRLEDREHHALRGSAIVAAWLEANPAIRDQIACPDQLLHLIAHHSEKDHFEPDPASAILKDADILDEIGVFSIFMAANWLDRTSPFFFYELNHRLKEREIPFCNNMLTRLNTKAGKAYLLEKRTFIESFIHQLDRENENVAPFDARFPLGPSTQDLN